LEKRPGTSRTWGSWGTASAAFRLAPAALRRLRSRIGLFGSWRGPDDGQDGGTEVIGERWPGGGYLGEVGVGRQREVGFRFWRKLDSKRWVGTSGFIGVFAILQRISNPPVAGSNPAGGAMTARSAFAKFTLRGLLA
jgi:hypothetical protein